MEKTSSDQVLINNHFYETLHEKWYTANDHPIALLRAENTVRTPWVLNQIKKKYRTSIQALDIGCGGGLLTNELALAGHDITGIDISSSSLDIAKRFDQTKKVKYQQANAYELPFKNESFDVVCAMDILEHLDHPTRLIQEASRVLRKQGLFFFHTFNRNFISNLIVIKGVDFFIKNAPSNMHVYRLFITPKEIKKMCVDVDLIVNTLVGLSPQLFKKAFLKMLFTRTVPSDFSFHFVKNLITGYCGIATKN